MRICAWAGDHCRDLDQSAQVPERLMS